EYILGQPGTVRFMVTDLAGRLVQEWNEAGRVGTQVTRWSGQDRNGRAVPAGVYSISLTAGKETARCRVVLVR
ncbi:T9SS type A sorting domain-containing protein, partial [candidate division WOR-3 bacterium]|nr:T9SS type A sorting domain-containing protein [candidate division WOR-3 bacterium]